MKLTKEERSWILYDCGNSAYSMAITTALLPIVFGMFDNVDSSMTLGYFNSIASIIIAVLSPILGTIADYKDKKTSMDVYEEEQEESAIISYDELLSKTQAIPKVEEVEVKSENYKHEEDFLDRLKNLNDNLK